MKNILKHIALLLVIILATASCENFLDRPSEDGYTTGMFYQNDTQREQGINYLYNSPWYDIIRFYIYGSETMCGNVYQGQNAYSTLTVNGTDQDLKNMAYSLWAVNAQCNTVIHNILASDSEEITDATRNRCIGEVLAWKAMTYFFLVRTFGDVPIIHDNTEVIKEASYNEVSKVDKADVYEYIVMTLEKAMELLPKNAYIGKLNRVDYYAAEALLAKVYLTRAGVSGTLEQGDLANARRYAEDVIKNSGRTLTPKYSDIFRMTPAQFQQTGEELFTWHWQCKEEAWTSQNSIQCDVGLVGFDENGNLWGDWKGPSVALQDLFGVSAADDPAQRVDTDDRRKATMMMFGDQYDYFWSDRGGFDFYRFFYDESYCPGGLTSNASNKSFGCGSGANYCKHLYGDVADHVAAFGYPSFGMFNQLPTHILRLGDIYLVCAEACYLTGDTQSALDYVNQVRARAHAPLYTSITINDIWKERRLELALEGDNWYDFVRRSYYDVNGCISELLAQRRSSYGGLDAAYKQYVTDEQGNYVGELTDVKPEMFTIPFPTEDVVMNPNVASTAPAVRVDVRATYSYDF